MSSNQSQICLFIVIIVAAAFQMACGAGLTSKCNSERSAKWDSFNLVKVDGAEICTSTAERLTIRHHNKDASALGPDYKRMLDRDVWTYYGGEPKSLASASIIRVSDGKMILLSIGTCSSVSIMEKFSTCSEVTFTDSAGSK